jgi:hypothetical protein
MVGLPRQPVFSKCHLRRPDSRDRQLAPSSNEAIKTRLTIDKTGHLNGVTLRERRRLRQLKSFHDHAKKRQASTPKTMMRSAEIAEPDLT